MSCIQYLIQSLMSKQICNESDMRLMIENSIKASSESVTQSSQSQSQPHSSQISINKYMKDMNEVLRELRMEVCYGCDESSDDNTSRHYYAIINTIDNDITRLSTVWSSKELSYLRKLMSAIIRNENKMISSTNALNIAREESIPISSAEKLIEIWCKNKWFDQLNDGYVAIGVRTLMEMNVYIREHFQQYVKNCYRCKKLCVRGTNCSECELKLHFYCADSTFIHNNTCPDPKCGKPFTQIGSNRDFMDTNASQNDQTNSDESNEQINRNVRKTRKRFRR